jgi:hypothetical protein
LQKARQRLSKNSYDDSSYLDTSVTKKEFLHNSNYDMKEQYDDYIEDELETGDTFVENIDDDDDNGIDDEKNLVFKCRSSTQKST